ncbi:hypothetical protein DPMN_087659 [Dreissena polymorpha]|uniref:Uncharacterized protein n=1 Tax=Dreissena polymorpha TaxID=45954 RepID=A0A9D4KTC8_DREPO|nr:hypothetical protein DPMN_087659 [Dreissena polymorpha]
MNLTPISQRTAHLCSKACPRGYQAENSVCGECTSSPDLYDWLYLGFMAITSILLHCFFIDYTNVKKE